MQGQVSARHIVLMVLAGAVLIAGLFLFHQVRSPVEVAQPPPASAPASAPAQREDPNAGPSLVASGAAKRDVVPGMSNSGSRSATGAPTVPPGEEQNSDRADPGMVAVMDQANKAYDRGDFEEAKAFATDVLAKLPSSIRMMRILVSASCIEGDAAVAQQWFDKLPPRDRAQMKIRCDRYGVSFRDPPE